MKIAWGGYSTLSRNRALRRELGEGLFRSFNNAVLSVLCQINEVSAVPGYPHDKIGVLLRLGLRFPEHFAADHIELDVRNTL